MPANGSVPMDHQHVEMSEHVFKQSRGLSSSSFIDKNNRPPSNKGSMLLNSRNTDMDLFSKDGNTSSGDNQSIAGDREMLLKTHSKHSDSFSDELVTSDRDSCVTMLPCHDTSFDVDNHKRDVTNPKNNILLSQDGVHLTSCMPQPIIVHSSKNSTEGFHLSSNSLLFSDSDSGADDTTERTFPRKIRQSHQPVYPAMTSSASHNGVLCSVPHAFSDFKPPPPPYGALRNKASALEPSRISSDCIVIH